MRSTRLLQSRARGLSRCSAIPDTGAIASHAIKVNDVLPAERTKASLKEIGKGQTAKEAAKAAGVEAEAQIIMPEEKSLEPPKPPVASGYVGAAFVAAAVALAAIELGLVAAALPNSHKVFSLQSEAPPHVAKPPPPPEPAAPPAAQMRPQPTRADPTRGLEEPTGWWQARDFYVLALLDPDNHDQDNGVFAIQEYGDTIVLAFREAEHAACMQRMLRAWPAPAAEQLFGGASPVDRAPTRIERTSRSDIDAVNCPMFVFVPPALLSGPVTEDPLRWKDEFTRATRGEQERCRRYARHAAAGRGPPVGVLDSYDAHDGSDDSDSEDDEIVRGWAGMAGTSGRDSVSDSDSTGYDSDVYDLAELARGHRGGGGGAAAAARGVASATPRSVAAAATSTDPPPSPGGDGGGGFAEFAGPGGPSLPDALRGRRVLRPFETDATLVFAAPLASLQLVYVPLVRRAASSSPADVLSLDISLEEGHRDVIAVVFEDLHDACALVALLGHTSGFTTADGVQRSVVGMPPAAALENAGRQRAEVVCFRKGFARKARVRVGCELRDVLDAMAGARRAAQVEGWATREAESERRGGGAA